MYLAGGTTSLLDEQTIPILDDAEGLEIGSRNYFSVKAWNSKPPLTASAVPYMDIQLEPNTQYTLSTNIPIQTNGQYDVFFFKGTDAPSSASNGVAKDLPRTITTNADGIVKVAMRSYNLANGYWIMLAKGNKALDWQPAIEDDMLFTAYADDALGSNFKKEYPNYNQFSISNAVIDAYLGNYEYTFDFKSATTAPISFTHANPIKLKAGTYVFSYEGKIPTGQPSVASLRFSTSPDNVNFTTLSGVGYLGQTKLTSEWTKFTATATLTQELYIGIQVYSHMFGTDYNTKVDVRNIVIREGSDATFAPSPKDDAIKSEMAYIGYSPLNSNNPKDYIWTPNPKIKGSIVRYANSADGTKDFTAIYPNENLFPNTKLLDTKDINASMDTVVFNGDETVTLRKSTVTTSRMFWNNSPITNIQPDPNRIYSAQIDIFIENGFTGIAGSSFFLRSYNSSGTAMDFANLDLAGIPSNQWVTLKIANAKPNGGTIPSRGMQFCVALANNALGTIRLRKPKLEYGAINTFQNTNKNEDPARAEMAYLGYSFKDSNDPADFTWYENPKAKGTYKRWANSPDGKVDFTDTYPNPNLFEITRPEVRNPATTKAEFLNNQNWDMAPIFETYGINVPYTLSFDLKSAVAGGINVYSQNGSGTKYNIGSKTVQATTEFQRFSMVIIPQLQSNANPQTQALLAFYGTYDSGRIPTVRNLKLEFGAKQTIDTPSASEDLLATIPQYVGISNKNSDNPADYVWTVTPEYTQARTDLGLESKVDDETFNDAQDHMNEQIDSKASADELQALAELTENLKESYEGFISDGGKYEADLQALEARATGLLLDLEDKVLDLDFLKTRMRLGEEGFEIGAEESSMKMLLTNDRLSFMDSGKEIAYFSNQQFKINRGAILESIQIGSHKITKISDKMTVFQFVPPL